MTRNQTTAIVVFGSCLWGIYWFPIKLLESLGLGGTSAGFALSAGAAPFLLAFFLYNLKIKPKFGFNKYAILGALMAGFAMGLWGASLAFTDVVRAILLFYLMPVWSIAIECLFMGRKFNLRSAAAIFAALFGIVLICRGEVPLEGLGALGDWMAFVSGVIWAIGAAILFKAKEPELSLLTTCAITGAIISGGFCLLFLLGGVEGQATLQNGFAALGLGLVYLIPLLCISLWGVSQLPPAMASFVLTFEVVVGVVTSAIFLDQPFGWFEVSGAFFIIMGAMLEVLSAQEEES